MKKNIISLISFLTIITLALLTGCSNPVIQEETTGKNSSGEVKFSWSQPGGSRGGLSRANAIQDARKVIITIEAADGTTVYSRKQLNLYNFNGSFISEPLSLKVGSYRLTDYLILNNAGTVIFATPKEGSKEATMVTDPLPINFTVSKDATSKVIPQVVDVTSATPADFGYTTFSIAEAKLFNFQISVMVYDAAANNFVATDAQLDVTSDTNSYSYALTGGTNSLTINDLNSSYTLTVRKAGYEDYRVTYTNAQLKAFFQSPLVVNLSTNQAPINNNFSFMLAVNIYDASSDRFIMTGAALDVTEDQKSYSYNLAAATNNITVDEITGSYTLTIRKAGYKDYRRTYTTAELKAFTLSPLVVSLTKEQSPVNSTFNFLISVKIYDASQDSFVLTDAVLDVTGDSSDIGNYNFNLTNRINTVTLKDVAGSYTLTVRKADYEDYRVTYSDVQLKNFSTNPLQVVLTKKMAPVNNIIRFADPGLEAAVRAEIKKPTGDIYTYDIITVTNLNAGGKNISSLSGLENLTSLITLNLSSNSITDISALSGLTRLTELNLNYNSISDISALSAMTKLTSLLLHKNSISDITVLTSKSELTTLNLSSNNIADITPLASLIKLQILNLGICGVSDLSPLSSLTNLTELNLGGNNITNITPLSSLTNLANLTLQDNDITDILGLSPLKLLVSLNMRNNRVRELAPLSTLNQLNYLNLDNNNIIEIEPLVNNSGIGLRDNIYLRNNPLSTNAINQITTLTNRGANVSR